jgi:hypothetical protein
VLGIQRLAISIAIRQLRSGAPALLIAPSTKRAFALVRTLTKHSHCLVVGGSLIARALNGTTAEVVTPAMLIQRCRSAGGMRSPVISFPDQLVGEGPSFAPIAFMGKTRWFSLVEAALALRYQPPIFALTSAGVARIRLSPIVYQHLLNEAPATLQRQLLQSLENELASGPGDWLAVSHLALHDIDAKEVQLRETLKDVYTLLSLERCNAASRRPDIEKAMLATRSALQGLGAIPSTALVWRQETK